MRTRALVIVAAMLAAAPALALDLSASTETMRACPKYGPGFFQIPGSSTCIKIGGRVTAEAGTGTRRVARESIAGFRTGARVSADVRTETPYGPVRAFVRVRAGDTSGRGTQAYVQTP